MHNHKFNRIGILLFLLSISLARSVAAADLSIVVSPAQAKVGETVTATVYVNSGGVAINNIEASIAVPPDTLEIQSVTQSGSIQTLWVEQPSFGNGTVSLNGGISNPGYTGANGKVATFYMKALKAGSAQISFKSGSVRANDGLGTDVTKSKSGASVTIANSVVVPVVPATPAPATVPTPVSTPGAASKKPSAPIVTSDTMPDVESWYKYASTTLSWNVPAGVTAVRTLVGSEPDSDPTAVQGLSVKSKTLENLKDGVTYFHIKFQSTAGWGPITHRKIQVDSTMPVVPVPEYKVLDSGRIVAEFNAEDDMSGVARVLLTTPGESAIVIESIPEDKRVQVAFPKSYSGTKNITIEVFDRAGNSSVAQLTIDFPLSEAVAEDAPTEFAFGSLVKKALVVLVGAATSVLGVVSKLDPLTVFVCALFVLIALGLYKAVLAYQYRKRYESLAQIRGDVNSMMDIVRRNMRKVTQAIVVDKSIKNIEVAEDILAESIMDDVKDIEKVLKAKADVRKKTRKKME